MAFCYMLYTDDGHTYIGATVDPNRRLRQHNQELAGGARATGMQVGRGLLWKRACYVVPYDAYPDKIEIVWDSEHLKERYHLT